MCIFVAICDVSLTYDLSVFSVCGFSCDLFLLSSVFTTGVHLVVINGTRSSRCTCVFKQCSLKCVSVKLLTCISSLLCNVTTWKFFLLTQKHWKEF